MHPSTLICTKWKKLNICFVLLFMVQCNYWKYYLLWYLIFQRDTARHLEWLKTIKESHGSVEFSSLSLATSINKRGIYTIKAQNQKKVQCMKLSLKWRRNNHLIRITYFWDNFTNHINRDLVKFPSISNVYKNMTLQKTVWRNIKFKLVNMIILRSKHLKHSIVVNIAFFSV